MRIQLQLPLEVQAQDLQKTEEKPSKRAHIRPQRWPHPEMGAQCSLWRARFPHQCGARPLVRKACLPCGETPPPTDRAVVWPQTSHTIPGFLDTVWSPSQHHAMGKTPSMRSRWNPRILEPRAIRFLRISPPSSVASPGHTDLSPSLTRRYSPSCPWRTGLSLGDGLCCVTAGVPRNLCLNSFPSKGASW